MIGLKNWVVVSYDDSNTYYRKNGLDLKLDVSYEPEKQAQVLCTVKAVSDRVWFHPRDPDSFEADVEMEIKEGDQVIVHFLAIKTAIKSGRKLSDNEVVLPLSSIFAVMELPIPRPVFGWILIRPDKIYKNGLENIDDSYYLSKTSGMIASVGQAPKRYRGHNGDLCSVHVEVGQRVRFRAKEAIPLFYSVQDKVGEVLYRMKRQDLLAVEIDDGGPVYSHITGRYEP